MPTVLHTLHLILIAAWAGVVLVEAVLELLPLHRPELADATATFHFWVDLLVELPLLLGVLVTGTLLLHGRQVDTRLALKIAAGSGAVAINLVCVAWVVAREQAARPMRRRLSRWILLTPAIGIPLGLLALFLGFGRIPP